MQSLLQITEPLLSNSLLSDFLIKFIHGILSKFPIEMNKKSCSDQAR